MANNDELKTNLTDCCDEINGCPDCDDAECPDSMKQADTSADQPTQDEQVSEQSTQDEQSDQPEMTQEQLEALKAFNEHMQNLNDQITQAQEQAQKERAKAEELSKRLVNLQAEFDNYRKRNTSSVNTAQVEGRCQVIIEVIKILDVIEQALSMIKDEATASGIKLIYRQIESVLSNFEVEEISAQGQEFDPNLHSAVELVKSQDHKSGEVVEVIQKGYRLGEKILRYASVKVAE